MAFNLDDIIIDRIQFGVAEDTESGAVLYTLTQLSDASIQISATSKDANDAQGTLVKRFWQGKTGTFTATNAMLNLNVLAAQTGAPKTIGTTANKITMPKIVKVPCTSKTQEIALEDFVGGAITVTAIGNNGAIGDNYKAGTDFVVGTKKITLSLGDKKQPQNVLIKYDRDVADAVKMYNSAEEFPSTCKLTLKALAVDPCEPGTLRACYIVLPSFQPSPEVDFSLTTDATFNYTGDLQVDYCSADKVLYEIYMAADDNEGIAK